MAEEIFIFRRKQVVSLECCKTLIPERSQLSFFMDVSEITNSLVITPRMSFFPSV